MVSFEVETYSAMEGSTLELCLVADVSLRTFPLVVVAEFVDMTATGMQAGWRTFRC